MPNVHVSSDARLLTIAPEGVLSAEGITRIIADHYPAFAGRLVLWDLTRADIMSLSQDDLAKIAAAVRNVVRQDETRKTAYAVADQRTYVKICKYLNETFSLRVAVEYAVFTSCEAARRWLDQG